MTDNEICTIYRTSKDKSAQIQILAELTCKNRAEIIKILTKGGEKVRIRIPSLKNKNLDDVSDGDYIKLLTKYLDRLDGKIKNLECEYREVASVIKGYAVVETQEEIEPESLEDEIARKINEAVTPTDRYNHGICARLTEEQCVSYEECLFCIANEAVKIVKDCISKRRELTTCEENVETAYAAPA